MVMVPEHVEVVLEGQLLNLGPRLQGVKDLEFGPLAVELEAGGLGFAEDGVDVDAGDLDLEAATLYEEGVGGLVRAGIEVEGPGLVIVADYRSVVGVDVRDPGDVGLK